MKPFGPILLTFALAAIAPAQKLAVSVDVPDGATVTGEKHFTVKVQSKNPVTQVEFYVNSLLRNHDDSTPYEFDLDSLGETDGDLKIKFVAYTSEGESAAKTLTLHVDNGISKGAPFHLTKAKDLLAVSKWDDAITEARIALKADKNSNEARVDLARAYMGKGVWDRAQKAAEDAEAADPNDLDALELVAAINLNRVFTTRSHSDDPSVSLNQISSALKTAVTARRKSLDKQIDGFGAVTDANRLAYTDLVMRGGRYSLAIEQLAPQFRRDPKNNDIANRLIYAYLRAGRMPDAREALDSLNKFGAPDAYGNALEAVYDSQAGDDGKADEAIKNAVLNDPDNLGVKSAQAFIALKRNKPQVLAQIGKDLASTDSHRTEVNYYIAALYNRMAEPESEKYFRQAVLIEPTNYDMYIEWGNYALGLGINGKDKKNSDAEVSYAQGLYNAALVANSSSSQALTGLCLVSIYQGKLDDAVRFGLAATQASPQYAAAHYAYAAAAGAKASSIKIIATSGNEALKAQQSELSNIAQKENDLAGKLDPVALSGRELPKVNHAWSYFATGGRTVVMVPPGRSGS